jgi:hypothetical protein
MMEFPNFQPIRKESKEQIHAILNGHIQTL